MKLVNIAIIGILVWYVFQLVYPQSQLEYFNGGYVHLDEHPIFQHGCVGEGSCIYNCESTGGCTNDNVLQDWKFTDKLRTKWKSPPLDSEIYNLQCKFGSIPTERSCCC
jgi:hypothetical protein